ncbi:hypothetical protein PMAYCL1PPCAC_27482, partial [Pristionchus mayeri]
TMQNSNSSKSSAQLQKLKPGIPTDKVFTQTKVGVKEFMRMNKNRPDLENVDTKKIEIRPLIVEILPYPSDLSFIGMSNLDKS